MFIIYRVTIIISQEIQNKKLSSHREQLFWPLYPVAARWTNPQMTWLRLHWGCPAWKNKASKCLVSNVFITKIIYHQKWFNRKSSFLNSKNWFEKILVKSYINTSPLIASVLSSSAPYACKNKFWAKKYCVWIHTSRINFKKSLKMISTVIFSVYT